MSRAQAARDALLTRSGSSPRPPVGLAHHARFSWTPNAIKFYVQREQWQSVFNALVLLGDSDPKGVGA